MTLLTLRPSVLLAAFPLVSFLFAAQSQDQDNDVPPIRVSVNLVQVEARVTDSKGVLITDLRPQDFEVLVDGVPQRLTSATYRRTGSMEVDISPLFRLYPL